MLNFRKVDLLGVKQISKALARKAGELIEIMVAYSPTEDSPLTQEDIRGLMGLKHASEVSKIRQTATKLLLGKNFAILDKKGSRGGYFLVRANNVADLEKVKVHEVADILEKITRNMTDLREVIQYRNIGGYTKPRAQKIVRGHRAVIEQHLEQLESLGYLKKMDKNVGDELWDLDQLVRKAML